jgi:hypothetical protein
LLPVGIIAGALGPMGESFSDFNTVKQGIVTTSILLGALIGSAYGNVYFIHSRLKCKRLIIMYLNFSGSIISDAIGKRWTTVILGNNSTILYEIV